MFHICTLKIGNTVIQLNPYIIFVDLYNTFKIIYPTN